MDFRQEIPGLPPDLDPKGPFFVAFPLAPPWPDVTAWFPAAPPFLRFIDPGDLHVTIAFLGSLVAEQVIPVRECLSSRDLVQGKRARLSGLMALPSTRRPTAVGFGFDHGADDLAASIDTLRPALCLAAGIEPDTRPALPHLTVARVPRRLSASQLHSLKQWLKSVDLPPCSVDLLPPCLYGRSIHHPRPRYVRFP